MQCATHPNVETELACGRCGKAICPKCLVQTPVGARCRDCAGLRRIPTYDIKPVFLLRAIAASLAVGAAAGGAWFLVTGPNAARGFGYVSLFLGMAMGYAVGETVSWAANRKRGAPLQGIAAVGVVLAYVVRNLLDGAGAIPQGDVFGYVTVGIAIIVAIGRLR